MWRVTLHLPFCGIHFGILDCKNGLLRHFVDEDRSTPLVVNLGCAVSGDSLCNMVQYASIIASYQFLFCGVGLCGWREHEEPALGHHRARLLAAEHPSSGCAP